jgi:hypothetical protein
MKQFIFLLALTALAFTGNAQTEKKHAPFIAAGVGYNPNKEFSKSFEAGTWGTTSPTSFSATFDIVTAPNAEGTRSTSYWVGIKPWFTVGEKEKLVYMVYMAPKVQVNGDNAMLLEVGFNPNYVLSNSVLLGVTIGNQSLQGSPLNPFAGVGLVYLFKK